MSIKGKSRSRGARSARAVTRGPKPAYVRVKTPLLRRRGVWLGIGLTLAVAAIAGITYGFIRERARDREEAQQLRMATAIGEYGAAVEPVLTTLGQPVPPTFFDAFPALATTLADLDVDEVTEEALEAAAATAEASVQSAADAASRLEEVSPTDLVSGLDLTREFVTAVVGSHADFVLALDLYEQVGLLLSMALDAEEGPAREELLERAGGVHEAAEQEFAQAYAAYIEAQVEAGTFAPQPAGATGVTGATG